jgi:hypothetical protein
MRFQIISFFLSLLAFNQVEGQNSVCQCKGLTVKYNDLCYCEEEASKINNCLANKNATIPPAIAVPSPTATSGSVLNLPGLARLPASDYKDCITYTGAVASNDGFISQNWIMLWTLATLSLFIFV